MNDQLIGPWWHVLSVTAPDGFPSAAGAAGAAGAAEAAWPVVGGTGSLVIGWLSRGDGAPLELITTIGPADPGGEGGVPAAGTATARTVAGTPATALTVPQDSHAAPPRAGARPEPRPLPFPAGAWGVRMAAGCADDLDRFVWAPCLAVRDPCPARTEPTAGPGLFETALTALMRRSFGWLVVAERAHTSEPERCSVRVLVGASGPDELDVLAPLLTGSAETGVPSYRLRSGTGTLSLAEALSSSQHGRDDGARSPFRVSPAALTALAGLPRLGVPGLRVTGPAGPGTGRSPDVGLGPGAGLGPDVGFRPDAPHIPVQALGRGVLLADGAPTSPAVRDVLGQLTSLGLAWLVVDRAGAGYETLVAGPDQPPIMVINPCDPDAVPLTVSPLAPEPGYPLHGHLAMVRALLDVSFAADEQFSLALAAALPRAYQAVGWEVVTGHRTVHHRDPAPARDVPSLAQLHAAVIDVIGQAGYGRDTRARLCSLADARFLPLLAGSAGRFLDGGHPADIGGLLHRNVVLTVHDIGAAADRAFVTGALVMRLAQHLRLRSRLRDGMSHGQVPPARPRDPQPAIGHVIVIGEARSILRDRGQGQAPTRAAEGFAALLGEFRAYGEGVVLAEQRPAVLVRDAVRNAAPIGGPPDGRPAAVPAAILTPVGRDPAVRAAATDLGPVLRGRRSAACGRLCREARACRLSELREAELLAASADHAWLRVWLETLALALLTDNPLPVVPAPLRRRWASLAARTRECLLARVIDLRVGARTAALRKSYDPSRFTAVVMSAAVNRLDGSRRAPGPAVGRGAARPGPAWVIPQLRWLHEMEQLCPLSGLGLAPAEHAPPLDFDLAGLRDWPGIRAGQRARALRRHPLSMDLAPNRLLAWAALAGTDGPVPFAADLAQIMPGMDHAQGLRHAAALMEVSGGVGAGPGWLETVLSWPRRFVVFYGDECVPADAADGPLA
jgi:hypothetical protein